MDRFMIHLPCEVPLGTKVTLIGRQGDEYISATEVAEYSGTINYEIITTHQFSCAENIYTEWKSCGSN